MSRNLPAQNSSVFLALPLEIRQQIYGFCIPQNHRIKAFYDGYYEKRGKGWISPPWHSDCIQNAHDGTYYSSERDHCDNCNPEYTYDRVADLEADSYEGEHHGTATLSDEDEDVGCVIGEDDQDNQSLYNVGDYCYMCKRYRPEVPPARRTALPGLLLVCRQITDEVEALLYGRNSFKLLVHANCEFYLRELKFGRREKMRRVALILRPMGISYEPTYRMDPEVWNGLLRSISNLRIVAEQPPPSFPDAWSKEKPCDSFEEWAAWLTPILEYLHQTVPSTTSILVDANEKERTTQIFSSVLQGRCRFERFGMADFIFKRGKYSWESGYWDYDDPASCRDVIDDCDYGLYYSD